MSSLGKEKKRQDKKRTAGVVSEVGSLTGNATQLISSRPSHAEGLGLEMSSPRGLHCAPHPLPLCPARPGRACLSVCLSLPRHPPTSHPPPPPPHDRYMGRSEAINGDRDRTREVLDDERVHDVHVGSWHPHLQHHDHLHGDLYSLQGHHQREQSLPKRRRRQHISALAEAHLYSSESFGGGRCALEDGEDGTSTRDGGRLDVIPRTKILAGAFRSATGDVKRGRSSR